MFIDFYHIYHLTLFILDAVCQTVLTLMKCHIRRLFISDCIVCKDKKNPIFLAFQIKEYKSRITLSVRLSVRAPVPSPILTYVLCAYASLYVCVHICVRVYFNMNISECFLILTFMLECNPDARVPACSLTFYHTVNTQMKQGSVLFA